MMNLQKISLMASAILAVTTASQASTVIVSYTTGAGSNVNEIITADKAFDSSTAIINNGDSGYSGPNTYGGFYLHGYSNAESQVKVADHNANGWTIRNKVVGETVTGIIGFSTGGIDAGANASLSSTASLSTPGLFNFHYFIENDGNFYISDAVNSNNEGGTFNYTLGDLSWNNYDPESSAAGIAFAADPVADPDFANIGFVGVVMSGNRTGDSSSSSFDMRLPEFQFAIVPEPSSTTLLALAMGLGITRRRR